MIKLSSTQSIAWQYLEDRTTNEVIYGGAAGGGKSMLLSIWHIYRRIKYPKTRGLIGRSKLKALEQSTLITLFKVASMMGYKMDKHYFYNQQKNIITWANGSVTILKDLFLYPSDPEFTSLGSTEFTDVCIDEVTEISEKAYEILNSRIRWMLTDYDLKPKLLATCNPSPGWVKERFVSDINDNPVILPDNIKLVRSFVDDNPDKNFVNIYKKQLERLNDYDRERLLYGNWNAKSEIKNPFAYAFKDDMISNEVSYLTEVPIIISIDFNINPFVCVVFQIFNRDAQEHCWAVDEIVIENGSIKLMCDRIIERYGNKLMTMRMTGDYSGKKRDISQSDTAHYYAQIQRMLNITQRQIITPVNPHHEKSRQDVNYFLHFYKNFKIGRNCKNLIFDLRNVECDNTGKIIKERRDVESQRADALDCFRYFVNTFMYKWIINHQKINK